jgi:hypothetical protein
MAGVGTSEERQNVVSEESTLASEDFDIDAALDSIVYVESIFQEKGYQQVIILTRFLFIEVSK